VKDIISHKHVSTNSRRNEARHGASKQASASASRRTPCMHDPTNDSDTSPDNKHGKKKYDIKAEPFRVCFDVAQRLHSPEEFDHRYNQHPTATLLDPHPKNSKMVKRLAPQALKTPFPCSRRHTTGVSATRLTVASPIPQPPQQDRLQTALLYLARASAHLPPSSVAAESLYDFAAPNWTLEKWKVEVERWRAVVTAAKEQSGGTGNESEKGSAGHWVRRAVGLLKREGDEGEYWRDGRDLEGLWGRVCRGCV